MSRNESTNTFTNGLVKDLTPINTPNTVLTDCLNGTILTYDGNEYTLQNDRGNYCLADCKLDTYYTPVGLKEYGDILYVVSYNPIEDKVEIGSYPSPSDKTISNTDATGENDNIGSVFDGESTSPESIKYSDLIQKSTLQAFIKSDNKDDLLLNPGDQYYLAIKNDGHTSIYEGRYYYVLDENGKAYNITDKIKVDDITNVEKSTNEYSYVNWDVPGYIAVKQKLAEIDDFDINIKKIKVPAYGNTSLVDLKFNFQLETTDPLFNENKSSTLECLKVRYQIKGLPKDESVFNSLFGRLPDETGINWRDAGKLNERSGYADSCIYYTDDITTTGNNAICSIVASEYSELEIIAWPILITTKKNTVTNEDGTVSVKEDTYIVEYDNLKKTLKYNLNQKGSAVDFKIGTERWQYSVDSENLKFSLLFDTTGLVPTAVLSEDVFLFYTLYRLNGEIVKYSTDELEYKHILCNDWYINGQTPLELSFEKYKKDCPANHFYAEDFYVIQFDFCSSDKYDESEVLKTCRKFITASELMNNQTANCFDTIPFDEWIAGYNGSIKNKTMDAFDVEWTTPKADDVAIGIGTENYNNWVNNGRTDGYNAFVYDDTYKQISDGFSIVGNLSASASCGVSSPVSTLRGPMWENLISNSGIQTNVTYTDGSVLTIPGNPYSEDWAWQDFYGTIKQTSQKRIPYYFTKVGLSDTTVIRDYDKQNAQWSGTTRVIEATYDSANNILKLTNATGNGHTSSFNQSMETNPVCSLSIPVIGSTDVSLFKISLGDNTQLSRNVATTNYMAVYTKGSRTVTNLILLPIQNSTDTTASDILSAWLNQVRVVTPIAGSEKKGAFYIAEQGSVETDNVLRATVSGTLKFGAFTYTCGEENIVLSNANGRASIVNSFVNNIDSDYNAVCDNLTKVSKEENQTWTFDDIKLADALLEDSSQTELDFSALDAKIDALETNIQKQNTVVNNQYSDLENDTIQKTYKDPSTHYYVNVNSTNNMSTTDILTLLTTNAVDDSFVKLFVQSVPTSGDSIRVCLAYTNTNTNYNIVDPR